LVATMRLAPRKRAAALVDLVADAVAAVGADAVHLDLVGDGPLRGRIEAQVERLGLASVVTVRGRLSRTEIRALYADSAVFLAPAELEAFGIAALEARAAGLAVIARRGTGIEEFVRDEVDGLIVSGDDSMADAVVRLVRDRPLLSAIRAHNCAHPPLFDWSDALAAADAEYARAAELVGRASGTPRK
jgi:glycosyltransferase involved in cell wall biosynthesis